MKSLRLTAACLCLAPAALLAQSDWVATYRMEMGGSAPVMKATSKVSFSPSAVRVDTEVTTSTGSPGSPNRAATTTSDMTMIQRLSEPDSMYLLNASTKSYSVMNLAAMRNGIKSDERWTMKRLGRSSVAGVPCENASMTSSKGSAVETCVATEIAGSSAWWSAMRRGSDSWVKALSDAGLKGLPVRLKMRSTDDRSIVDMELVRFEKGSIPASRFEIPAGYTKAAGGAATMTPEQKKKMAEGLAKMTPEQRKAYEDAMKRAGATPQ
jgi:hypothetical protein